MSLKVVSVESFGGFVQLTGLDLVGRSLGIAYQVRHVETASKSLDSLSKYLG